MISAQELAERRRQCIELFSAAHIVLTAKEKENIEIADFGLGTFPQTGLGVLVYVNTTRVCAKELAMLPGQTCPEHRHPTKGERLGKEETFRCRSGAVYLYVPGAPAASPACRPPQGHEAAYTVFHEVRLLPGEQYTLAPDTLHWFQAGPAGAVVSEFSTTSTDEADVFTDPEISRFTKIGK
jgi:D-lyxose ketol-isomerase